MRADLLSRVSNSTIKTMQFPVFRNFWETLRIFSKVGSVLRSGCFNRPSISSSNCSLLGACMDSYFKSVLEKSGMDRVSSKCFYPLRASERVKIE